MAVLTRVAGRARVSASESSATPRRPQLRAQRDRLCWHHFAGTWRRNQDSARRCAASLRSESSRDQWATAPRTNANARLRSRLVVHRARPNTKSVSARRSRSSGLSLRRIRSSRWSGSRAACARPSSSSARPWTMRALSTEGWRSDTFPCKSPIARMLTCWAASYFCSL